MSDIYFVSSPYSHEDKEVVKLRYEQVSKYVAKLVAEGRVTFSPITYGHVLCGFHDMPSDFEFWGNFCLTFLAKSTKLIVLKLDGWFESIGVQGEIEFAKKNNIPIAYVTFKEEDYESIV